jgi:DNA polymerase-1
VMLPPTFEQFEEVWVYDFEFHAPSGCVPGPICMVAKEIRTDKAVRIWLEGEDGKHLAYPFPHSALLVSFYAIAEVSCHLALGWPTPAQTLDLFTEFRCMTNGRVGVSASLLSAARSFGLAAGDADTKDENRALAIRGGPFSESERSSLLIYCESDVDLLAGLLIRMAPLLDVPRALHRGRYMVAAARMEHVGVPVDGSGLADVKTKWGQIQTRLVAEVDRDFEVFEGATFKASRFDAYTRRQGISWPRLPSGRLDLRDDTFKDLARIHPCLRKLRELRTSLSQMRLSEITVGTDGRNRTMLSPFRSVTSRNQPSNTKFIFGPSVWMRSFIQAPPGMALAYIDWSQQEFGIAAALSGDSNMMDAYRSGDPYLDFAKRAGAVPSEATKASHPAEREIFKQCILAVQYGMGAESLAYRIGKVECAARELLQMHRRVFSRFWRWNSAYVNHSLMTGRASTVFGWNRRVDSAVNMRSLANFPMQANGAEMLRLACCLITEAGIRLCAPIHDAVLVEAPEAKLDSIVNETKAHMREASRAVLGGFELESDATIVRPLERYSDPRGQEMWSLVSRLRTEMDCSA